MQGRAITPRTFKLKEKPVDHIGANRVKVKQLMRKVKERETQKLDKNEPIKALWKSEKYKDVSSKLKQMLEVNRSNYYSLYMKIN